MYRFYVDENYAIIKQKKNVHLNLYKYVVVGKN